MQRNVAGHTTGRTQEVESASRKRAKLAAGKRKPKTPKIALPSKEYARQFKELESVLSGRKQKMEILIEKRQGGTAMYVYDRVKRLLNDISAHAKTQSKITKVFEAYYQYVCQRYPDNTQLSSAFVAALSRNSLKVSLDAFEKMVFAEMGRGTSPEAFHAYPPRSLFMRNTVRREMHMGSQDQEKAQAAERWMRETRPPFEILLRDYGDS